ncbi:tabinhibitin 4-like isoform X1 [Zeugodacus cucurbitae]|uniref:tabinhibitin 4-like isoform X1 n=1 Tax=Zeugodacus cucurbitae TaxID=28588 RepID=UPI0023D95925|nr:tabinhibitin 4-like isoform X1 [Zeugodacus cucurbitae]
MFNIQYIRFYLIAILIWHSIYTDAYYYCDKESKLCGTRKHFMCDPDAVPSKGDALGLLPLTGSIKRRYVDRHNEHRNRIAGGEVKFKGGKKFPKATRMREVIWDDELAYIAGIHAKRCNKQPDDCHSTERFPGSGQNLYKNETGKPTTGTDMIVYAIDSWWAQSELVDDGNAMVDEFPKGIGEPDRSDTTSSISFDVFIDYGNETAVQGELPKSPDAWKKIGNFSAIANERAAFVGCGLAVCHNSTSNAYCIHVTCNYSRTNVIGTFMYKKGNSSASECDYYESVPSSKYPHLCKNTGKIFEDGK